VLIANILAPLTNAEQWVLERLHSIGLGWGLAIVGLVVLVRLCTLPLIVKQFKSQRELREHMPEMKKLQARHKDDKQRLQQEMQAYYREHGINPLASFAPLLIQIPVFISLYYLMRQDVKSGLFGTDGFLFIPHLTEKPVGSVLITLILCYLVSQVSGSLVATRAMKGGQKGLMLALPLLFVTVVARFPAGLAVYWITTSLWTLGQQLVMWRLQPNMAPTSLTSAMSMESGGSMAVDDLGPEKSSSKASSRSPANGNGSSGSNGAGARSKPPPRKRKKKKAHGRRR
jgi:YidC/Oxa1 family membrane protein insertase